jgi:hypothetical protein
VTGLLYLGEALPHASKISFVRQPSYGFGFGVRQPMTSAKSALTVSVMTSDSAYLLKITRAISLARLLTSLALLQDAFAVFCKSMNALRRLAYPGIVETDMKGGVSMSKVLSSRLNERILSVYGGFTGRNILRFHFSDQYILELRKIVKFSKRKGVSKAKRLRSPSFALLNMFIIAVLYPRRITQRSSLGTAWISATKVSWTPFRNGHSPPLLSTPLPLLLSL